MTVEHPQLGLTCEICAGILYPEHCAIDLDGERYDVHGGECARQAGIRQRARTAREVIDSARRLGGDIERAQQLVNNLSDRRRRELQLLNRNYAYSYRHIADEVGLSGGRVAQIASQPPAPDHPEQESF